MSNPGPLSEVEKLLEQMNLNSPQRTASLLLGVESISQQKETWWTLINQHFSFLNEQAEQQYKDDPRALFITHYNRIIQAMGSQGYNEATPFLLDSLRGDIDKFQNSALSVKSKQLLYAICAGNGHQKDLENLSPNEMVCEQLIGAAFIGNLPLIQTILINHAQEIISDNIYSLIWNSPFSGQFNVVNKILAERGKQISDENKAKLLAHAASWGHLDVVQAILIQCSEKISPEYKGEVLTLAASCGRLNVVQELLTQCGSQIPAESKWLKLSVVAAAAAGQLVVVRHLLNVDAIREIAIRSMRLNLGASDREQQINLLINHLADNNPKLMESLQERKKRYNEALFLFSLRRSRQEKDVLWQTPKEIVKIIATMIQESPPPPAP